MCSRYGMKENTDGVEILLGNVAEKCRGWGLKISNMGTWKGGPFHFCSTTLWSHPTGTSQYSRTYHTSLSLPWAYMGYTALFCSVLFKFKGLLPLLLVLAILLLLKVIRLQSGMIYCQDIHWYMAELLEYQVVIPCFFLDSRISTGCQFYDVFQPPFQLGFMWLLSGQLDVNRSRVRMLENFCYPFGHSVTPPQYLSIKLMPCYQSTNSSLGQTCMAHYMQVS